MNKSILLIFIMFSQTVLSYDLKYPAGLTVESYAKVPGARQMTISPQGTLYVGTMEAGKVYAVTKDKKVHVIKSELNYPQGVVWHKDALYIAEIQQISKIERIDETYLKDPKLIPIKSFPHDKHHGWKSIAIGPDKMLYVPVGAPCNVCEKPFPYQSLLKMNFDGTALVQVASGIRNTVGFTWHPESKELYFTEMGRDMMGDDLPPDEINVITKPNEHFGFPYLHAGRIKDPQFGNKVPKGLVMTPPLYSILAHSSPIGIAFFPKSKSPKEYHNCFLVAEHGSWNRSRKTGYQVSMGCLENGKIKSYAPFITGFKKGELSLGRPAHILFTDDGSFFLSEDEPGEIFKVSFKK